MVAFVLINTELTIIKIIRIIISMNIRMMRLNVDDIITKYLNLLSSLCKVTIIKLFAQETDTRFPAYRGFQD